MNNKSTYTKSQVIGMLLNLGCEPVEPEIYPVIKNNNAKYVKMLRFSLNTSSLLNVLPGDSEDFEENKTIALTYKGSHSTIYTQNTTIDLDDNKKVYNDEEIYKLINEIYNGHNVMEGNLLIFKNKEVDDLVNNYRNAISNISCYSVVDNANRQLARYVYNYANNHSINTFANFSQAVKTDSAIVKEKLNRLNTLRRYTNKLNVEKVVDTISNCHSYSTKLKNQLNEYKVNNNVIPAQENTVKLYNGSIAPIR